MSHTYPMTQLNFYDFSNDEPDHPSMGMWCWFNGGDAYLPFRHMEWIFVARTDEL